MTFGSESTIYNNSSWHCHKRVFRVRRLLAPSSGSETSVSSLTPASAIISDALLLIKKKIKKFSVLDILFELGKYALNKFLKRVLVVGLNF